MSAQKHTFSFNPVLINTPNAVYAVHPLALDIPNPERTGVAVGWHVKQVDPVLDHAVEYDDNLLYEPANGFNPDQVLQMDPAATLRYNELEYMYWGHDDAFPVDVLLEF